MNGASPASAGTEDEARKIDIDCTREAVRSFRPTTEQIQDSHVEPERAFLLRAAIRYDLVEQDEMKVDEAFDQLVDQFLHIVFPLPAIDRWAQSLWDNPGWGLAAVEYRQHRPAPTDPRCIRRVTSKQLNGRGHQ